MPPIEVISLARRDNIDTACELVLSATAGAQVWLLLPWRHPMGLELINHKRLMRVGEDAGVDLRLVSQHAGTRALAREAGLPPYRFGPLRLRRYRRSRRQARRSLRERIQSYRGRLGFWYRPRPRHLGFGPALLALLSIGALAVGIVAVGAAIVPGAEIVLEPAYDPVAASARLTANPLFDDIDYGTATIPARMAQVIVESDGEAPSSGRIDVADGHASGQVVFANRTDQPVTVPKGTIVRTVSGVNVRFYTLVDIEVPGSLYAHSRVAVVALEPGPTGNVQALTIKAVEGDIANSVEVINDAPTSGGTIRRVPIVAPEDFDRLRAQMIATLQDRAYEELVRELDEGEFIPPGTVDVRVMAQHFDQVIDEQSDVLSMHMTVVARGLAIDSEHIDAFARLLLEQTASEPRELIADSLSVEPSDEVYVDEAQIAYGIKKASFDIEAQGVLTSIIDKEEVRRVVRGRTLDEAKSWLQRELTLRTEPRISLVPDWWERMPLLPARIDLVVSSGAL